MPSTHTTLHFHVVFSTKNREPWLVPGNRGRVHEYLGGVVRGIGGVALAVGGVSDHVHVFMSLDSTHRLSDVMRELKSESSAWIKAEFGLSGVAWQGYGAFSVSPPDVEMVRSYVLGQKEHHRTKTFQEEYLAMLKRAELEFDERYLW